MSKRSPKQPPPKTTASNQKPFYIALAVIVIGGGAFIFSRVHAASVVSIPANVAVTTADTSGFHGYFLGSPTAPVEVTEYGDLECPGCAGFSQIQFPYVKTRLINTGKIRLRYRDFPWDQLHRHPRVAAHALACANDQGHNWDVIEKMFATQDSWASLPDPMPALGDIVKGVGGDVGVWTTCMKSAKYAGRIQASLEEGTAIGVKSTPSFLIGGRIYEGLGSDQMEHLVDSLIAASSAANAAGGTHRP
ncbi:MAG TPA: thioredoxin domain-containing protein [Gemmatimonadales bacterium]|jgi:protein-disulfide isomerase